MDNVLDHSVISSFKEFITYKLYNDLSAYSNKTVPLFNYTPTRRILGKATYGSPYCQWLYDSSVTGANIPTGLSGILRGVSGLSFDFKNGRIFINSGTPVDSTINVSVPDFNIYITTSSVQRILLENKYEYYPDLSAATAPIKPDSIVAPCIFISYDGSDNKSWALGGVERSNFSVQVAVFADNLEKALGVQRIIRDISSRIFPVLPFTPLNELNDLKYGYWNYDIVYQNITDPSTFVYVDKTSFKILDLDYINQEHPNIIVGLGNVSLSKFRTVGQEELIYPYVYIDQDNITYFTFDDNSLSKVSE